MMADYEFNQPVPYTLHVEDHLLTTTKKKLELTRYPLEREDIADDDWGQGAKVKVVQRLADYWQDGYDWRVQELYGFLEPHSQLRCCC